MTNRAASYIQIKKYKEALFDCEQALIVNKSFVKAHQRAYKCYLSLGELEKAEFSLTQAKALGDSTANQQLQVIKTVGIESRVIWYIASGHGETDKGVAGGEDQVLGCVGV